RAKEHLKEFDELRKALSDDPVMSYVEKAKALFHFAKTFDHDLAIFRTVYLNEKISEKRRREITEKLDRYDRLMSWAGKDAAGEITLTDAQVAALGLELKGRSTQTEKVARDKAKEIDRNTGMMVQKQVNGQNVWVEAKATDSTVVLNRTDMDSTLSSKQVAGVREIDHWLIKTCLDSKQRIPFVSRLFELSMRERMYVYYLIERDRLEKTDITDIAVSQSSYIPDQKHLSSKMSRTRFFRLWEYPTKDGMVAHKWEKMEAGLQLVRTAQVQEAIRLFSKINTMGDELTEQKVMRKEAEAQIPTPQGNASFEEKLEYAEKVRDHWLQEAIVSLEKCAKAIQTREKAILHKQSKEAAKNAAIAEATATLEHLKDCDNKLVEMVLQHNAANWQEQGNVDLQKGVNSKYKKRDSNLKQNAFNLMGKGVATAGKIPGILPFIPIFKNNLNSAGLAYSAGTLATLGGVMGLSQSLLGTWKLIKTVKSGEIRVSDSILGLSKMALTDTNAVIGTAAGIATGAKAVPVVKAAIESVGMTTAANYALLGVSGVVGIVGLAGDAVELTTILKSDAHQTSAARKFKKLNTARVFDNAPNDKAYIQGVQKLQDRIMTKKTTSMAFSTVTNVGNVLASTATVAMTATGFGAAFVPLVSAAWGGIALGITLANKLTEYYMASHSKTKTVEEFLQFDNIEIPTEIKDKKQKERYKQSMLAHMAAELGFTTFRSLFKYVTGKYATFLYNNLFYRNSGTLEMGAGQPAVTAYTPIYEGQQTPGSISDMCASMVKALGLRIKYPKDANDVSHRHPSLQMIAAKLGA
nr:hypothetical protein [Lachnospiraceae bacterium]